MGSDMTPGHRRRFRLIFPLFLFAGIAYIIGGVKFALHQELALAFVLCGVGFTVAAWVFGRPPRQT
jgi:hypothetical protein